MNDLLKTGFVTFTMFFVNLSFIVFALVLPLFGIVCLHNTVGGNPKGLRLGIVNEEVSSHQECTNRSLRTFQLEDYECRLNKISCRFIKDIDDEFAIKVC